MATINGTNENNTLYGTAWADLIRGFDGDDRIYGRAGNDTIYGGDDHDSIWGENGDDVIVVDQSGSKTALKQIADTLRGFIGFLLLGQSTLFGDQRLTVGHRDLVVIRVNLGEGEETVAVSAVIHERCLQRGFDPRDLCQVDVASQLALVQGLEIKVIDPRSIGHDHPSFLGVGGVDQHLLCHVSCFRAALRVLPCRG